MNSFIHFVFLQISYRIVPIDALVSEIAMTGVFAIRSETSEALSLSSTAAAAMCFSLCGAYRPAEVRGEPFQKNRASVADQQSS